MPTTILATKLYVPKHRPSIVSRARLMQRLHETLQSKLTLISAPAGFGKTTVVSEWVAGFGRPVAWLSLDEADSDPVRFLTYMVAAPQTIDASVVENGRKALASPQVPPAELIMTTLLNNITAI